MSFSILWHPFAMTADAPLLNSAVPLAARMRPRKLADIVGQGHLLAKGLPLFELAQPIGPNRERANTSVLLWGPPGTGKTTIAQVVARESGMRFVELSAVSATVKEVREVMAKARHDGEVYGTGTLLFLDEIHRFSKAQQDALLPGVEAGWVTLIAATTENPSFSVIAPLLSRSLLCVLEPLAESDIAALIVRATASSDGLAGAFKLGEHVPEDIARLAGGDARRALTVLEAAARHASSDQRNEISAADLDAAVDRALARYDRDGDQHYDIISAFIKSVRGSDADAAIHWLARMVEGGEDPRFIARRLIILAAEDIGLADPQALPLAVATAEAVAQIGMPEGRIPLAEATIYLALAPKSNSAYTAINQALEDVRNGLLSDVPKALRSSNYGLAKTIGNGAGYLYPHDDSRAVVPQKYLSSKVLKARYVQLRSLGFEAQLAERWAKLRQIIRGE